MIIRRIDDYMVTDRFMDWHKLVVAEAGFSVLDQYARLIHGLEIQLIQDFADQVNQRNEPGSLFPRAPISALPRRYLRSVQNTDIPVHIDEFCSDLKQFLTAIYTTIHAKKILVNLHVSSAPVPSEYITAVEKVFRSGGEKAGIDELLVFT